MRFLVINIIFSRGCLALVGVGCCGLADQLNRFSISKGRCRMLSKIEIEMNCFLGQTIL